MFAVELVQIQVDHRYTRECSRGTMATYFPLTVLLSLLSPQGLDNETLTPLDWIELLRIRLFRDSLGFNAIMPWLALPDNLEA